MKWSLSGWSDWVYCVQNEMSEVGLQEKGTVWDEVLLVREVHQKQKGIEVTGEAPMSQIDLAHVAFCCGPWPWCPTSPVLAIPSHQSCRIVSGATKDKRGREGINSLPHPQVQVMPEVFTELPQMANWIPETPPNLHVATTECHFLRFWMADCVKRSWLELPRAGPCSLMQSHLWVLLVPAKQVPVFL